MKSNVKSDFVMPIVVLMLICLVMSGLLAALNYITEPIIADTEAAIAEAARAEVLPAADGFTQVDADVDGTFVTEVYKANNDAGYVFMITCNGYGGKNTMKLICGVDADGNITATKTLQHAETAGLGSKTTADDWRANFPGKNAETLSTIDTISGATFSSNYYLEGIQSALDVYAVVSRN